MKAKSRIVVMTVILICRAYAQIAGPAAELRDVVVAEDHGSLTLTIMTSSPVLGSVTIAHHPERIVLRLPNTVDLQKKGRLQIRKNGVRAYSIVPAELSNDIDIVIELDRARPYAFRSDNEQMILTFDRNTKQADNAIPGAKRGTLTGIFHREKKPQASTAEAAGPTPAATVGVFGDGGLPAPPETASAPKIIQGPGSSGSVTGGPPNSAPSGQVSSGSPNAGNTVVAAANTSTLPATSSTAAVPANQSDAMAPQENPPHVATDEKAPVLAIRAPDPSLRTVFHVKYVAEGVAYLDGGRSSGLKDGVKLEIIDGDLPARDGVAVVPSDPRVVAELVVSGVAETSAVTDVHSPKRPVKVGDLAYLSEEDTQSLVHETALSPTRKYPAVVSFTLDDPQDEEVREEVPRPPMPSVNRIRGRIGVDYMETLTHGSASMSSAGYGMMFRGDFTRIGGTYWNLSGYWRGRFTSESPSQGPTLNDLINRTYHLSMTYDSPNSPWVAGFGRLYLPWATSLDTLDGGYVGRKLSGTATTGIFGGSTPDPTSYDYSPNRQIAGTFLNFTGGDFARLHYTSTVGAGASFLSWKLDRPFGFLENTVSYTQRISFYDALQVDSPAGNAAVSAPGAGLSRNFFTFRVQPISRLELDINETYFRDIPTFDPALVGTGLLDKYLFQGFSGGLRAEIIEKVSIYGQVGKSSRTGDTSGSLDELYGLTFGRLPYGLRADAHYARFNSSFGSGNYKSASISRNFGEGFRTEVLAGKQAFNSSLTNQDNSWFVTGRAEMNLGAHYFIQGDYTVNRGQMSYDQCLFTFGFRFDSKRRLQ